MTVQTRDWLQEARHRLTWIREPTQGFAGDFARGEIAWFQDGILNASYNCLDRHLKTHPDKTALIWEKNEPGQAETLSFEQLYTDTCQFAHLLKNLGVQKGDRVCIYLPLTPKAIIAMQACARIGAVHTVVFGGFSAEALKSRIQDAHCHVLITTDQAMRGAKPVLFAETVHQALQGETPIRDIIFVDTSTRSIPQMPAKIHTHTFEALQTNLPKTYTPEPMNAEDPLFILYTSGSTGKPKGVVHTTGGYLLYAALTHHTVFDIQPQDIYWCTADIGWITGHSYVAYGPLANGTTTLIHSGLPTYPDARRSWEIIDTHQVTQFYTAPTAIRMLMSAGNSYLETSTRKSLRVLGSVGEPINPEAWHWFADHVGHHRCPVMDTWWQTETGGLMLAPPPLLAQQKPGAAMQPIVGITPVLLDEHQHLIQGEGEGALCIQHPWPGMMRGIYGDPARFYETYFKPYPGVYFSGDKARRDHGGDLWILGRMDDVLSIAGHRLGTSEVESALCLHEHVAEAAVVGKPDPLTGEAIAAFIVLREGVSHTQGLDKILSDLTRAQIGPIAQIKHLWFCSALPKTRSGKIMRRILRKLVMGERDTLGDLSTLANPECIPELMQKVS